MLTPFFHPRTGRLREFASGVCFACDLVAKLFYAASDVRTFAILFLLSLRHLFSFQPA